MPERTTTEPLLDVEGASFAYLGRFPALYDVTIAVPAGASLALLGANGSGKSTLLKLLDGLVFPDTGSYRAFGAAVTERGLEDERFNAGFRSRIGFVFQNSDAQVFSPTVRDEIAFGPLNLGLPVSEAAARVDDVLTMLEMTDLADRAPHQLSGGEKKRVAMASVLAMNPEVLLLDEPTATLDPRMQQWLIDLMIALRDADKTIVLATHDLALASVVARRAVVFDEDHRVAADGPVTEILADQALLRAVNLVADVPASSSGWRARAAEPGR